MAINRRKFILGASAAGLNALTPLKSYAAAQGGFLATARDSLSGRFYLVRMGDGFEIEWEAPLPGRAHEILIRPGTDEGLVIARRPGLFAFSFDLTSGEKRRLVPEPLARHLYGHGAFCPDGDFLYLSENLYDTGRGVIGMYDANDGYRRVCEFSSGGIGPHQLVSMAGGKILAVANGGIRTHPETGRKKLNLDSMAPNLTYLDAFSGAPLHRAGFATPRENKLSIRHITALPGGRVAIACQDQGPSGDQLPLIYIHDPAGRAVGASVPAHSPLTPLTTPARVTKKMSGYCGDIAYEAKTDIIAVSAPRGGIVGFWNASSGRFLRTIGVPDGCAITASERESGFAVLSGLGAAMTIPLSDRPVAAAKRHRLRQWDNHMAALKP